MDRREYNIQVFEDTIDRIKKSRDLKQKTAEAIKNQVFIKEGEDVSYETQKYPEPCKITVTKNRTMQAAANYADKKVAVLNFASASNPGGGVVNGAGAQEECLCRVSNLYLCLTDKKLWKPFYAAHRAARNNIHNDDIIFTPDVFVLKDDDYNLYSAEKCFSVDVITCAAPNLREYPSNRYNHDFQKPVVLSDDELYKVHVKRAKKILEVAAANNEEILILGAFGCGAFRNNPNVVAKAYETALEEFKNAFEQVEFAVYCNEWDSENYDVFKNVLG